MNPIKAKYLTAISHTVVGHLQPTLSDITEICPHLSPTQAQDLLYTNGYIACPPLLVQDQVNVVCLSPSCNFDATTDTHRRDDDGKIIASQPTIYYAFTERAQDRSGTKEALAFAQANWGDDLIQLKPVSVLQIYLQDPSDLNDRKYPRQKLVLYLALNRPYQEIINDHTKPESEVVDAAILHLTTNRIVWGELKQDQGGYTAYNCAYCGTGLDLTGCSGCGFTFRDDGIRCGRGTPLSKKMVEFLQAQEFTFKQDPALAWAKELASFNEYAVQMSKRF